MSNLDKLYLFFQTMQKYNFEFSEDIVKDLNKLVKSDMDSFLIQVTKDFLTFDYDNLNRFEKINLIAKQKEEIRGMQLYRYEYRKEGNLRILFVMKVKKKSYFLCAFNENGGKHKSKDSYKINIERAISIFKKIRSDEDE